MKFELDEYHRGVTDNELIADLKRVASDLNKKAVTRDEQDEKGKFHSTTLCPPFRELVCALEKGGARNDENTDESSCGRFV